MPETGRKYGPYEILGTLGSGGMGFVYRAWDARLHREVAIKLLHDEFSMPGMRERFLREARAASALNHPNICTIFDIGEQGGEPYLIMELLEGETLRDRIDYKSIPVDEILCIGREVAEALGAAHAKGVIHRDVKPANIFLVDRPNGGFQSKMLDFGLAKFQGGVLGARTNRSMELTAVGATVGTLAYMSPEQARGETLDSRSDLFSLGVVLYEMATRHIPFPGATSALVFVKLLNQQPESVRNWNEGIPKELDRIILKLMAKERTARFQTAQELVEALAKVGDKPATGGWLRKAVSTVPLVRMPDPVVRERRPAGRKGSTDSQMEAGPPRVSPPTPLQPQRTSGDEPQFLRPVARVPKGDTSPPPEFRIAGGSSGAPLASDGTLPMVSMAAASGAPESNNASAEPDLRRQVAADPVDSPNPAVAGKPSVADPTSTTGNLTGPAQTDDQHPRLDQGTRSAPGSVDNSEFDAPVREPFERDSDPGERRVARTRFSPMLLAAGGLLLAALAVTAFLLIRRGHFGATLLSNSDLIVLSEIENRTGDKSLDGTIAEGLQIDLAQSPFLYLRSLDSYLTARHEIAPDGGGETSGQAIARNTAQRLGAKAYLFGSIRGTTAPYLIHIDLINSGSNDVMTTAEEHVPSLQQVTGAIDHLADALRSNAGESSDSISRSNMPLAREATSNMEALHALSMGESAFYNGKALDALRFYQQAANLEPKFVQAQLRLSVLYRKERAELAAADAAKLALAAADNVSERTRALAQYEYEMNASGDYLRASNLIRQQVTARPHDSEALEALARSLRLQGRVAEALQMAQQAYAEDPFNIDAYTQAENSLIDLDRYDASAQLEGQVQKLGLGHAGGTLTAAYLGGRQDAIDQAIAAIEAPHTGFRADWNYGIYLDNAGHLAAGAALWRNRASAAGGVPGLESAAGFLLSQGALDRALLGDCAPALALARESDGVPQGITALFNTGMADALCGNSSRASEIASRLEQTYPQSFAVKGYYLADIKAAISLHDQDPAAALEILKPARQFDLISLTPVLRGRAHVALRQVQIGIVDFQTVLAHRGVPFIVGNVAYPVAELGVARAFADTGDVGNSAQAYRRFLQLWSTADPNQPLLTEARSHSK